MADVEVMIAARSDVGRVRKNNEDSFSVTDLTTGSRYENGASSGVMKVSEKGVLLALSDGMGGRQAGEVASELVLDSVRSAMQAETGNSTEQRIEAAVRGANAK